ncbi:MAG TPA: BREX-3 system P-loop-containing protein BrxF, partial [Nitrospiria bacterium]|nr:BREX-3 system P-loop-containing protein BrxF [Nitrospiria bacterium]
MMVESLANQIINMLERAAELYHRLILVTAPAGEGKTLALKSVKEITGAPLINVNLELSRILLDLTEHQRSLQVPQLLNKIVAQRDSEIVLLDNIEILFDISLKLDPLRLLQGLARNNTLIAAWNGAIIGNYITYAMPEHHEYRKY